MTLRVGPFTFAQGRGSGMSFTAELNSLVTCPSCGDQHLEPMPEFSCLLAYACSSCGTVLRPADDDCCIFCTYGSIPCPPIQALRQGHGDGAGCRSELKGATQAVLQMTL